MGFLTEHPFYVHRVLGQPLRAALHRNKDNNATISSLSTAREALESLAQYLRSQRRHVYSAILT